MLRTVRDTQIFCEVVGDSGSLLLAFHGGLGLDHHYLRPWLDPLSAVARVAFFDLRGHGQSGGRETLGSADHATLCSDADALRQQLADKPAIVFGHSYGGFLALEYALLYPENVAGLILCSSAVSAAHAPAALAAAVSRGEPDALAVLARTLAEPVRSDEEFASQWKTVLPLYFHWKDSAKSANVFSKTIFSAEGYNRAFFSWLGTFDVCARLHEISAPTLVLSGSDDWIMSPRLAGDALVEAIPAATQVVFESSGHFPFVEENDRFINVTSEWIRSIS
jgi:proline iminopeptidase